MENATKLTKGNNAELNDKKELDAVAKISLEFRNFVEDMEDLIKVSTSLTGEDFNKVKLQMNDLLASGKKSVDGVRLSMRNRTQKTAAMTNTYVHEKPWQAIGIGVVAGLFLGYLLPRRA